MTHFRIRYRVSGQHVHVRIFSAPALNVTFAQNGTLVFSEEEWEAFKQCFTAGVRLGAAFNGVILREECCLDGTTDKSPYDYAGGACEGCPRV